ncbi:restriction endonuclease [Anaerobacillus sp. CMMVII]|uniref:restriction endonuclease n=1 Tax=Anaerobacillus sp. CMMVII TaxID=2755588 RepID=UPI0021B763F1|nr:restriction endonuclease [Anaerobacillus sp. CMMVII]MCT8137892.1 restriction endonuclease [Anaerobacillus sp. CMMVII]
MGRRRKSYSKGEFIFGAIFFLFILAAQHPNIVPYIILGIILLLSFRYLLTFKKYSRSVFQVQDHYFIISMVRHWKLKNKIIFGAVVFFLLGFLDTYSPTPALKFIFSWLYVLIFFGLIGYGLKKIYSFFKSLIFNVRSFSGISIEDLDNLNGLEFEHALAPIFRSQGYHAEVTIGSGDFGADLLLKKQKDKVVVQAKCYGEGKKVGVDAVYEVVGAAGYYNANKKIVITNRHFTESAEVLARRNGVILFNRDDLIRFINQFNTMNKKLNTDGSGIEI